MAEIKSKNLVMVIAAMVICAVLCIAMTMQLRASAAGDTDDASASFARAAEAGLENEVDRSEIAGVVRRAHEALD